MLRQMLAKEGFEVHEAEDGEQGLEMLRQQRVDVIITDILMPQADGLEIIRAAKRERPGVRIVAITGGGRTGELDYLAEAQEFGADSTLRKPFGKQALLDTVSRLIVGESDGPL